MQLIERAEPMQVRREHELLSAHAVVAQQEMDYRDYMSPEQKAWIMGCRCALAWALGLPKGGAKVEQMLRGLPVFGVADARLGTKFLNEQGAKLE